MMQNVYFGCAAVGGAILVLQTLASMLGMGHHDADVGLDDVHDGHSLGHDHVDGDAFVKLFTFKTIVAFLTFFGLAGLASERAGMHAGTTLVIALLAGAIALYGVAWLMKGFAKLQSKGNLKLENAIGLNAKVYLRIPPRGEGIGKVTVTVQGRTIELKAVTPGAELPTGASVKVVAVREADTLEVAALGATQAPRNVES